MELDLIWILIGLPAAFGLGWLASRLDLRQLRIDNRQAPRAYFKGLNFLLRSEEHTSELQSRFGISYAVFCLKKKK